MQKHALPPAGSNWVTGAKFFNRETEQKILTRNIEQGLHTLLTGQRRMGKTSLIREVARQLEERASDPWRHIFVDLDDCASCEDMVARIAVEIDKVDQQNNVIKAIQQRLQKLTSNVEQIKGFGFELKIREVLNSGNWQQHGSELIASLGIDSPCVLIIDELPNLLLRLEHKEGAEQVGLALDWIRRSMQAVEPPRKLTVVISGSIGLEPIVQRLGITKSINQLETYRLKPWRRKIARQCFEARAAYDELSYEDGALDHLLDRIANFIPFHVQRASSKLYDFLMEEERSVITKADADYVYDKVLLGSEGSQMVQHYLSRLKETVGEDLSDIAIECVSLMADGKSRDFDDIQGVLEQEVARDRLLWLLDVLTHDGYFEESDSQWQFPAGLLRDWWNKRVVMEQKK